MPLATTHAMPHAPQWATVVAVPVSQPLAALPSQLPKPAAQLATAHAPAEQVGVALGRTQALAQRPQLATEVARLTSQPLAALPSQLA